MNTIKDLSLLRKLLTTMKNISDEFEDPKRQIKSISDFVAEAEKKVLDVTKARRVGSFQSSGEVVDKIAAKLKMNRGTKVKGNSLVTGVDTGFQQLNKFTQGFHPGELIILVKCRLLRQK